MSIERPCQNVTSRIWLMRINQSGAVYSRQNAFDFLRVAAALAVLLSHSFPIVGLQEPTPVAGLTMGKLAVAVFFAISGYLVCQSWQTDPHVGRFAARRALRIFPGLLVMLLLTVLVLGPALTEVRLSEYFGAGATRKSLLYGALGLGSFPLPGLFEHNPMPGGVNGSLWTIKYELLMYCLLALLGRLTGRVTPGWILAALSGAACWIVLWLAGVPSLSVPGMWRLGLEVYVDRIAYLSVYFFAGVGLYMMRQKVPLSWSAVAVGVVSLLLVDNANFAMLVSWLVVPYSAICFAVRAPALFTRLKGHDYSYGVYIYAFPVQQACANIGMQHGYGWGGVTLTSLAATLALAAVSWYFVEEPALRLKNRLRAVGIGTYIPQ